MPAPPTIVGDRYRLGALIAASGMADVYTATDERLGRPVALKFLRAAGPTDAPRFRREMATLARLEHPNLVRLYDADVLDATPYLVLELVDGPSLAERLAADGPVGADVAAHLLTDLAGALAYIHDRDVVHRDVKPANVLLDPDGRARLTDFGIAWVGGATAMTGTAMTIGTAAYLAPEQARGDQVTAAADVYSLGLVVLECLTGERAFPGSPVESAVARLTRDPAIPDAIDDDWRRLLAGMTSRDPAARPTAASIATGGTAAVGVSIDRDTASTAPTAPTAPTASTAPTDAARTVPMGSVEAVGETAVLPAPANHVDAQSSRRWHAVPIVAAIIVLALIALGLSGAFSTDNPTVDAALGAGSTTTTVPPSTTSTAAPTTAPPATAAPVVVATSNCDALEAQRQALDEQKKAAGHAKGADKAASDAERKAIDDEKKQVDAALKACP